MVILARISWRNTTRKHRMASDSGSPRHSPKTGNADAQLEAKPTPEPVPSRNTDSAAISHGDSQSHLSFAPNLIQTAAASKAANPPVSVGARVKVTVDDVAFGGEGVGRCGEFVIFVPFVLLDEEVLVEVVEVKKRFARGRLVEVLRSSPHRVQPVCPHFMECGGCQYQHMAYERQLEVKHRQVASLIERMGGFDPAVVSTAIPCPAPYGYRNRIMIRTQWDKTEQRLKIGFLRSDSRLVVDIEQCAIAEPGINERIPAVRSNPPARGGIKVVLRVPPKDWVLPNDSFFQNNFHLLPRLVELVADALKAGATRYLIDAYCGVGFFSLELASRVDRFVGMELDLPAIRAARLNAENRQIHNGEFVVGRTEDLLPEWLLRFDPDRSCVILDPPRTGCAKEVLTSIASRKIHQIIYVSCHPATLSRDLRTLCDAGGYKLHQVTPLDMFPQTQHVECVAVLRRPDAAGAGD